METVTYIITLKNVPVRKIIVQKRAKIDMNWANALGGDGYHQLTI